VGILRGEWVILRCSAALHIQSQSNFFFRITSEKLSEKTFQSSERPSLNVVAVVRKIGLGRLEIMTADKTFPLIPFSKSVTLVVGAVMPSVRTRLLRFSKA
jgi:hypothetical protein